jgi:DNA-binding NtrC family response regulator
LLGNSTLTREIQGALVRLGLQVKLVSTAQEALEALLERENDLLVVEITAVGHTGVGLADLAEAARERGTSLALLTSHSPLKNVACASLLGAIGSLNKWMSVRVTAERLSALVTHARYSRQLGIVFNSEMPWVESDDEIALLAA